MNYKITKAKKAHHCAQCHTLVVPEQSYVKYTDESLRGWYDVKLCIDCAISNLEITICEKRIEIEKLKKLKMENENNVNNLHTS